LIIISDHLVDLSFKIPSRRDSCFFLVAVGVGSIGYELLVGYEVYLSG
jgi:hypothetical protein